MLWAMHCEFESLSVLDSLTIHRISVNTVLLEFFSSAMLTEFHWISEALTDSNLECA